MLVLSVVYTGDGGVSSSMISIISFCGVDDEIVGGGVIADDDDVELTCVCCAVA